MYPKVVQTECNSCKPMNNKALSSVHILEFSNLWHGWLVHVNYNALHKLINMNHIPTFQIDTNHKCKSYVEAKNCKEY